MHDRQMLQQVSASQATEGFSADSVLRGVRWNEDGALQDLAERLPQLVWIAGSDGHKEYCNRQYLDYVGVADMEALDREWINFIHPDYRENAGRRWRRAVETGTPYVFEYPLRRKDGVYRQFVARARPMRDGAGRVVRWLGTSTDIEDQRTAAEKKRGEEKLETAARVACHLSHEINNPLTAVTNLVFLALADPATPQRTRDLLEVADRELKRMAHVTRRTLGFHHQLHGRDSADVVELLEAVLELGASRMANMGVHAHVEARGKTRLFCFADDLQQIFAILLGNAVDAMTAADSVVMRVGTSRSWKDGTEGIRVTIADTGMGIAPESLPRIFEPFYTTKALSVGLGLWVVKELVEKHNGTIRVRSRARGGVRGTVFVLYFPHVAQDER